VVAFGVFVMADPVLAVTKYTLPQGEAGNQEQSRKNGQRFHRR
jgi:hypothetical protein